VKTVEENIFGASERQCICEGRKSLVLLRGSHNLPTRPSVKTKIRVAILRWQGAEFPDQESGILIF
jgi:hypothetical protein